MLTYAGTQLQERIKYITSLPQAPAIDGEVAAVGKKAGQEYYQNMCMKAVNQCIGRAIRQKKKSTIRGKKTRTIRRVLSEYLHEISSDNLANRNHAKD
jgi:hypothetical protein